MKLTRPSRAASTLVLGVFLLVATTIFAQQLAKPTEEAAHTARVICTMVGKYHINHSEVDDSISPKLFDRFIDLLDPQKLYFLAADIEEFKAQRMQLDDQLKKGDVNFAYDVFSRYTDRVRERVEHAQRLVDLPHDFTVEEEMVTESKGLAWSKSTDELNERWRKRVKFEVLTFRLDDKEMEEARDRLHKRYRSILRSIEETESSEILEMYLSSLTHCFDPHSSYMSPETLEEFRIQMKLSLDGIGAALRSEDGYTFVASVVKGGAADKDGRLEVGDKIIGVGQETGDFEDIVEMKLSKVVRLIRGTRGSKVRLQCVKEDSSEMVTYELTRQKIELQESAVKGEIINTKDRIGRDARIGVINIPSFYRDFSGAEQGLEDFKSTARDLQKVLLDFKKQGGVDAIVVDLRYNGGGALSEAIEVTGLFIDEGPVVQVKETGSKVKTLIDEIPGAFNEPLVVVCNRLSASASEIFAGAIKDYRRGIVVGDKTTHGKGTVQNVMPVGLNMFSFFNDRKDRGALKLTINQFYRVNGDSTQNLGVTSDVVLPSLLDNMEIGESSLENALAFDRIAASDFNMLAYVNGEVIDKLAKSSGERVAASKDFKGIQADIQKYLDRKKRMTVSLNEAKLRKEREDDKKKDDDKDKDDDKEGPVLPVTAYNDELLNIAVDYAELVGSRKTAKR
ncbi:MAG: carboxy terminal-processing peptidase [Planctomycetota bacterium]|nr:carboxy terminal-processing peptidase [Planctomycetota bacterium]MDA1250067.1 carboxy terminal-processing peptidase [Planctomycetota bacterium]